MFLIGLFLIKLVLYYTIWLNNSLIWFPYVVHLFIKQRI